MPSFNYFEGLKPEEAALARAKGVGLVVLFGFVLLAVMGMSPKEKTPREKIEVLLNNEDAKDYMDAESMAKEFYSKPSLRWSRDGLDVGSGCRYIGKGVWDAYGTVEEETDHSVTLTPWQVYFRPPETTPLYVRVGDRDAGDRSFALNRAGKG